jgi:O-antigen biosynthesis protein
MKYFAKIDLSNKNNSHTLAFDLIQQISEGKCLKILEVGCSAGYFGAALKDVGHQVWGVEPSQDAAKVARSLLDGVFEGFVQDYFKANSDKKFDVIVFGDVLEHISYPEEVLFLCKAHLNTSGAIVASVPNVAHLAIRTMLLEGRWDYAELGILDRTHLRFFTRSSLTQLFSNSAYQVLRIYPVRLAASQVDELCGLNLDSKMLKAASALVQDDCSNDFQYVLGAKPVSDVATATKLNSAEAKEQKPRLVCCLTSIDSSLSEIRLRLPLERWALQTGGDVRFMNLHDYPKTDLEWGDIYVFQRNASAHVVGLVKQLKASGKKIIFEIDDLLTDLPPFLAHHAAGTNAQKPFLFEAMGLANAITVTTSRLGSELSRHNNNVQCIPNCSDGTARVAKQHDVTPDQVTLVVASSDAVLVDFIVPALKLIQNKYSVKIWGIGPPGDFLAKSGLDIEKIQNMPYLNFKSLIASVDNGIGVIPLDDSLFSSCKSPIKYFDYSVAGIPVICSDVPPYSDHIVSGDNGLLAINTTEAWFSAIESLVLSHATRTKYANSAINYVNRSYNIGVAAMAWEKLILSLGKEGHITRQKILYSQHHETPVLNKSSLRWIASKATSPTAYIKALRTIKNHGVSVLINRLRRR